MKISETILVTGGAGYIGSHCVLELLSSGYQVIVIDNLKNSKLQYLKEIQKLYPPERCLFFNVDLNNSHDLQMVLKAHHVDGVIHFAANKSISQSIKNPLEFYTNNVVSSINLFQAMKNFKIRKIIFSSSATVYDPGNEMPLSEDKSLVRPTNPYGNSKFHIENILQDLCQADEELAVGVLRYFNPLGAHESGLIGEDPIEAQGNLGPALLQSLNSGDKKFKIFGSDYNTKDGTCIRDFIHVVDLALGHLKALTFLEGGHGFNIWNLGSGSGYSVGEVLRKFEEVAGIKLHKEFLPRRAGDVAVSYANTAKALHELNWQAERGLGIMLRDLSHWNNKTFNKSSTL
jgi:UDP-glucose 4-epimerase